MKHFKTAVLSSILTACSGQAMACGDTPFIGEICTFAFSYCPQGFVNADGRLLPLQQNQALYALLGTRYGGDGKATFGVPNLTGRSVVGTGNANPSAGISAVALASTRGTETVTLSVANLPAHNHSATFAPTSNSSPVQINISTQSGTLQVPINGSMLSAGNAGTSNNATIYSNGTAQPNTVTLGGVTGGVFTGGTVVIGNTGGNVAVPNLPPQIGLTQCIAVTGAYPMIP
jgi:microcystin-dependent protein